MKKLFIFCCFIIYVPSLLQAQVPDTTHQQKDTIKNIAVDTINKYHTALDAVLANNHFLNSKGTAVSMVAKIKKPHSNEMVFYLLAGLIGLLAVIKFFYQGYFTNLFRVFFNTSLRQGQLTDQLMQAQVPSLFFNIFFVLSGGIYVYFILTHFKLVSNGHIAALIASCILILASIYVFKFCTLKFTGWVTGNQPATDSYIFIIFLICKIIGIMLLPFIVLIAFAQASIASATAVFSLLVLGLLFLLRFFRSYGILQNQLKVSRFHFFLYLTGIEIIPLLLIYKGLLVLLSKSL